MAEHDVDTPRNPRRMEPTGIERVTSCLQSTFAHALNEARNRREFKDRGPSEGSPDAPG